MHGITRSKRISMHIMNNYRHREVTTTDVARELGETQKLTASVIRDMRERGQLIKVREEPGEGGNIRYVHQVAFGTRHTGYPVVNRNLRDYSNEELLSELRRRMAA